MLPKFQNSFALDKNLQTLIESFNLSNKNPGAIPRNRIQNTLTYMPGAPIRPPGTQGTQTLSKLYPQSQKTYSKKKYHLSYNPILPSSILSTLLNISTTFLNDQQDIIFKFSPNNKILQIITLDRPLRDQKDDELNMNPYLAPNYSYQQLYKLKIDFKLEDTDEIEINGNDHVITILTKASIKQQKNDQNKKQIQCINQDIINKNESLIVQIQMKFLKEWYVKLGNNLFTAKKALQDCFKSLQLPKMKFTAFDNQVSTQEQPVINSQPDLNKKQSIKIEVKQEPEKEQQEEIEQPAQISEKDLQNLFPLVSEEFVQRQKEALEKKNSTSEEKIKRLFEEVRIKQFKSQPYNADKNFFRCPYHRCQKGYRKPNQLKNHMKQNHQKLSEIGFTIDDNGEFKYNEKILDYCLLLWKVYPNFVKSVINEMRQRKEQPSA